jgi:hypothetical protein
MKFKNGKMPHLNAFWNLNIKDVNTLKKLVLGSLLVAFDLEYSSNKGESTPQNITEAGLAFLQVDADNYLQPFPQDSSMESFYEQNHIKGYSIHSVKIPEKKNHREKLKFGTKILVDSHQISSTVIELLATAVTATSPKYNIILLGWSIGAELGWISCDCPQLATYFTAWVDLQDMVVSKDPPSLLRTLQAIGVADHDPDSRNRGHHASEDAIRCLAVLAKLLTGEPPYVPQAVVQYNHVPSLPKGPPPGVPRTAPPKYPFTARITANGGPLPPIHQTPNSLQRQFSCYNLKAVGLNREEMRKNGFCKCWWLAFQTLEDLKQFVSDHHGTSISGISLSIQVVAYT